MTDKAASVLAKLKNKAKISGITLEFEVVIAEIQTFIEPVFDVIVNEEEWQKMWNSKVIKWDNTSAIHVYRE